MYQQPDGMLKQNPELKQKKVSTRVTIYTSRNVIEADAHGFPRMRLTDLLNSSDTFVPLTNAVIYDLDSQKEISRSPFVSINKTSIALVFEK
jgi:hypothetical protein